MLLHPRRAAFALALCTTLAALLDPLPAIADCSLTKTGNIPLPDLGPAKYQGFVGGLYPGGSNVIPPAHLAAGFAAAGQIQSLNAAGNPDPNGTIVLTSIGMSSVTQEWYEDGSTAFLPRANADPSKSSHLTIVDGAEGGKDAPEWANLSDNVWDNFRTRLQNAGVTPQQVQVAWFEDAIAYPVLIGGFPLHAQVLQGYLETILRNLKTTCPNLRVVFISSRDRAYTDFPNVLNPEPYAYESSFSMQWTVADQINGKGNLNFDPAKGAVVAPYLRWGPYLWTDGTTPRSDGNTWLCRDVDSHDFTHPSDSGTKKVADQLLAFFKTDPMAAPWFLKAPTRMPPVVTMSATPPGGPAGTSFQFTASATDPNAQITSYQWTFDDGTFSAAQNPAKSYPVAGSYNVHLTVTDATGNYSTSTLPVLVGGLPTPTPTPSLTPTPTPTASPSATPTPTATPSSTPTPTVTPTPSPTPSPTASPSALLNVSTRGEVGIGDMVLIGGFIIDGNGNKDVLLRAIGPSLANQNVSGPLADPVLELHDQAGAVVATNDNWQTTQLGGIITSSQVAAIQAADLAPPNSKESVILATLAPGSYTEIVRGAGGSTGVGLTELYDLDESGSAQLVNISTRGSVQTADQVMIGGFIVGGPDASHILVRALGPSLAGSAVTNVLADPTLELHDGNGMLLQSDNDWADSQEDAITATQLAPPNAREAAILRIVPPGNYTAVVAGKDGGTGIGLVEVYHLPNE